MMPRLLVGAILAVVFVTPPKLSGQQVEVERAEEAEEVETDSVAAEFEEFMALEAAEMTSVRLGGEVRLEGSSAHDPGRPPGRVTVRLDPAAPNLMIDENVRADAAGRWIANGSLLGRDSIAVLITADHDDYVYDKDPIEVYLSPDEHRVLGLKIVLTSKELARSRARLAGDAGVQRVIRRSLESDSTKVRDVLAHYDRALRFRRGEDVYFRRADFLARIEWYPECLEAYDDWIAYRREESMTGEPGKPWAGKLDCARKLANDRGLEEDWVLVADIARHALEEGITASRFFGNWLDALLELSDSGGDFRLLGNQVVQNSELKTEWIDLYYIHFRKGEEPPEELTPREATCGAIHLSRSIGRSTSRAGCPG